MATVQDGMMKLWDAAEAWMTKAASEKKAGGEPKFVDMPSLLVAKFASSAAMALHGVTLQALETRALAITRMREPAKSEAYLRTVPAGGPVAADDGSEATVLKHRARIWQFGMDELYSLKGASPLHSVLKCMKSNLMGKNMNNTEKHPIEVLYNLALPLSPGDPIPDFSTGVANGNAVVISCHVCCIVAIELKWLDADSDLNSDPAILAEVAKRLIRCIRLTCTHDPKGDLQEQIQETLSSKIQASSRTRPTTMQMLFSFMRLVKTRVTARLSEGEILKAVLNDYQRAESLQNFRLNHDEIDAIKFLHCRSATFQARVKIMWGQEKPAHTAWPMNLFTEIYLQEDVKLPVPEPELFSVEWLDPIVTFIGAAMMACNAGCAQGAKQLIRESSNCNSEHTSPGLQTISPGQQFSRNQSQSTTSLQLELAIASIS